jgi:hypothetical protein
MILDLLLTKTASFTINHLGVPSNSSISIVNTAATLTESLTKTPSDYTGTAFLDTKYSFAYVMSVVDSFRSGQNLVPGPDIDPSTKQFTFNSANSVNITSPKTDDISMYESLLSEDKIPYTISPISTTKFPIKDETDEKLQHEYDFFRQLNIPDPRSFLSFDSYIENLQTNYKSILTPKRNRGFLNVSNLDPADGRPIGQRGQDIGYDLGTMYILGMTHPGKTFGGFSSGFTLGGTIDSGTGPIGTVLGIRDFTGLTGPSGATNGLIGGISGSFTHGYFALLVGEVGPTGGAGATSYVAGATIESSIFSGAVGGTAKIGYIHNLNDITIGGAKTSILNLISPLVDIAPIGITVGNTGGAGTLVEGVHQIREYDQYPLRIAELLDEFTSAHDRYDLVAGFSSGAGNTYTYETPRQVGEDDNMSPFGPYTNAIRLSPNTGQTGGASELQELAYYMIHELPAKRTEFDLHVKSLMTAGSEIDTLYKLSEWGIPETFKRLYEQ